jgi:hypothetical protein
MKNLNNTMFKEIYKEAAYALGIFENNGAAKSYGETEMHQAFVVNANSIGYTFGDDDRPERIVKAFFASSAAYLSKVKVAKAEEAVALILTDVAGNFKFAGIVEYHENTENPDEPGNWSYTMTFNEKDVDSLEKKRTVKKLLYSSDAFKAVFDKVAYDVAAIQFQHNTYMFDACLLVIDTLLQVLDREAQEGTVVDIDLPGYFVASVSVEDGEKVFAITPDGNMKEVIKDDTALDK